MTYLLGTLSFSGVHNSLPPDAILRQEKPVKVSVFPTKLHMRVACPAHLTLLHLSHASIEQEELYIM